jgi:hypothetical protein
MRTSAGGCQCGVDAVLVREHVVCEVVTVLGATLRAQLVPTACASVHLLSVIRCMRGVCIAHYLWWHVDRTGTAMLAAVEWLACTSCNKAHTHITTTM